MVTRGDFAMMQPGAREPLDGKKLVFLVGAPRSGTTWLQLLLSRSPAVASATETHLFTEYMQSLFSRWDASHRADEFVGLHLLLDEFEYKKILRDTAAAVLAKIGERKPTATVILEKTPDHVLQWRRILDLFPDASFIHLIRHPHAVVASLMAAASGWGKRWAPADVTEATEMWIASVTAGRQIKSATDRYYELKYRDLIEDEPQHLKCIFEWMGVDASLEECGGYYSDCTIDKLKAGAVKDPVWEIQRLPPSFFRAGRRDQWREDLSGWQVAVIERAAKPLMEEFGFECARPRGGAVSAIASLRALETAVRRGLKWRLNALAKHL